PAALGEAVQGLDDALRRTGEDEAELCASCLQVPAHRRRRTPPAVVQGAMEIVERVVIPARLGVAQQRQASHRSTSSFPVLNRRMIRSIAASSGTRETRTSGGKADSSRDGMAADRITNTPRSPCRRISRPKAWASRALMTLSS